jgi:hypothetical protein
MAVPYLKNHHILHSPQNGGLITSAVAIRKSHLQKSFATAIRSSSHQDCFACADLRPHKFATAIRRIALPKRICARYPPGLLCLRGFASA